VEVSVTLRRGHGNMDGLGRRRQRLVQSRPARKGIMLVGMMLIQY
jgi:hypothetical protein